MTDGMSYTDFVLVLTGMLCLTAVACTYLASSGRARARDEDDPRHTGRP